MSWSIDRIPPRRADPGREAWGIYRAGVIGTAGRSRVAEFPTRDTASAILDELSSGRMMESEARERGRQAFVNENRAAGNEDIGPAGP